MTREQNLLFEFIEDLLSYEWDPLGLNGFGPRDEYQTYVPQIFGLAVGNATVDQIARKLRSIETEAIGVTGNFEKCKQLARIIVQKKEILLNGPSGPQ
ncbi:MAG: hypothetical protein ICV83_26115 [Cytophagales bacterium]|nr:hypothetical protein [Cytophagales bacterium]